MSYHGIKHSKNSQIIFAETTKFSDLKKNINNSTQVTFTKFLTYFLFCLILIRIFFSYFLTQLQFHPPYFMFSFSTNFRTRVSRTQRDFSFFMILF